LSCRPLLSHGDWQLVVEELIGQDGDQQLRLTGPWVIDLSVVY
jgi:hypothetical protein